MALLADNDFFQGSHMSSEFLWFVIGAGGILAFVALVAMAASLANARDERRYGRADAHTRPDSGFEHRSTIGGTYYRPWDDLYQRRGYDSASELAAAEAASAARSAPAAAGPNVVAGSSTPIGAQGSAPKEDG